MKSSSLVATAMVPQGVLSSKHGTDDISAPAWVMGAADPTSGTVSVHEIIRGLGYLLRNGWKPLRTIVIASWDAEEVSFIFGLHLHARTDVTMQYGLIGSTEWGEDFAPWIQEHVVTYLNLGECCGTSIHPYSFLP